MKLNIKINNKNNIIIVVLCICAILFMTVGFSAYNQTLNFGGSAHLEPNGEIYISSVRTLSLRHAEASPSWTKNSINFNLKFVGTTEATSTSDYTASFEITITNDSFFDNIFSVPNYIPTITRQSNGEQIDSSCLEYQITGISEGDIISSKSSKIFTVNFTFTNPLNEIDTFIINGDLSINVNEEDIASLRASVDSSIIGDLRGTKERTTFTIKVINTYSTAKTFTISLEGNKFLAKAVNSSNAPQYTIPANTEQTYEFDVTKASGEQYYYDKSMVNVYITPSGGSNISAGRVSILVDKNSDYNDVEAPTISNVKATIQNTEESVKVTWNCSDDDVDHYTVITYKSNGEKIGTDTVDCSKTEITISNLEENYYYFTVFGTDINSNTATEAEIKSATTSAGKASRSDDTKLKWNFTVTIEQSTYNYLNEKFTIDKSQIVTVKKGKNYTVKITKKITSPLFPSETNISVTTDGKTREFTYDNNLVYATLTINNIQGDIVISKKDSTCLAEGTKILLADGSYKNIEDITYTDLLKVYNHKNGETTNVYPIWIEEASTSSRYEKITFSDGSLLKVVNSHSMFDVDKRKYVDVSNTDEFNVGTRVYKLVNNKLEAVTVTNIEYINEEVKYYNVVSTMHYNIIANDFLTTDTTSSISNIYGFDENAKYSDNYYKISEIDDKLNYEDVSFIPYYLYEGLNLKNAKSLLKNGLDIEFLKSFINAKTISPITKNGEMYFMVTTSQDDVNSDNIESYLYKEGSTYTLPKIGAKYFEDTASGNIYKEGDCIEIHNSIHLKIVK